MKQGLSLDLVVAPLAHIGALFFTCVTCYCTLQHQRCKALPFDAALPPLRGGQVKIKPLGANSKQPERRFMLTSVHQLLKQSSKQPSIPRSGNSIGTPPAYWQKSCRTPRGGVFRAVSASWCVACVLWFPVWRTLCATVLGCILQAQ